MLRDQQGRLTLGSVQGLEMLRDQQGRLAFGSVPRLRLLILGYHQITGKKEKWFFVSAASSAQGRKMLRYFPLEADSIMVLKWLSVADRFAKAYLDNKLAPLGINSSQHVYLLKICEQPGISQDSLLGTVYVHPSNVVRMVAALEKKGFLTRMPCQQDKRTWLLYPTDRALAIAGQIRAACQETENLLLDALPPEVRGEFQRQLLLVGRTISGAMGMEREEDDFDV